VKDEVKNAVLHKYLEACKYKHALAFFQWRTKYTKNQLAQLVFDDRISFLKTQEAERQKKVKLAEKMEKTGLDECADDDDMPPPDL
jgi:hypothetical protein